MAAVTAPELIAVEQAVAPAAPIPVLPVAARELPSLDGLRSVARVAILCGHIFHGRNHASNAIFNRVGDFGVCVFFVISGFLITTVLWKDARRNGKVNLGKFYLRRTMRIFPPFYAYLAVVAIGGALGFLVIPHGARWWPAFFYVSNVVNTNDWLTGHSWSLALEEQYYLVWPIALAIFIRRRGAAKGIQIGARLVIAALILFPLIRIAAFGATRSGATVAGLMFDFVAAGSGMALLQETGQFETQRAFLAACVGRMMPYTGLMALSLHVIFAGTHRWMFAVDAALSTTAEAILLAMFIAWATRNPQHPIGRVLNFRPLRIIGIASYSLYLYQQLFFEPDAPFHWPVLAGLLALCACATTSYLLVEVPALRLRERIERLIWPPKKEAGTRSTRVPA